MMGFSAFNYARADYQDLLQCHKDQTMEILCGRAPIHQGHLQRSLLRFCGAIMSQPHSGFSLDISSKIYPILDKAYLNDYNVPN